jgi:hypothetical protein
VLIDSETGVEAEPILVDRTTGRPVDGPDFIFTAGPAASPPFRDRYAGRPTPASAPRDSSDKERRRETQGLDEH